MVLVPPPSFPSHETYGANSKILPIPSSPGSGSVVHREVPDENPCATVRGSWGRRRRDLGPGGPRSRYC